MADTESFGIIIPGDTAEREFGSAGVSVPFSSEKLLSIAEMTANLLMFNIIEEKLIILGDNRKVLYPEGLNVPADTIFKVFSKSKVLELIKSGSGDENFIEFRGDTLTISNNDSTLEYGSLCPPWC